MNHQCTASSAALCFYCRCENSHSQLPFLSLLHSGNVFLPDHLPFGGERGGSRCKSRHEGEKVKPKPQTPQGQPCHFSNSSLLRCRRPQLSLSLGCAPPVRRASLPGRGLGEEGCSQQEKGSLHALGQVLCSCQYP